MGGRGRLLRSTVGSLGLAIVLCSSFVLDLAAAEQVSVTAREIARKLGLSDEQIEALERGEPVSTELEAVSDKEIGLTFSAVSGAGIDAIHELSATGRGFDYDPVIIAHGEIGESPAESLAALTLPDVEIDRLSEVEAGDEFNLSPDELARIHEAAGVESPSERRQAVMKEYRSLLVARITAYQSRGLAGIEPYLRQDGELVKPGDEITAALAGFMESGVIRKQTYEALIGYPEAKFPGNNDRLHWIVMDANGRPAVALLHRSWIRAPAVLFTSERRFYVGHTFNSMLDISGVLPLEGGGTIFFYAIRTFTDQVDGFMSGAARSIGRKIMKGELDELYRAYRELVGDDAPS